MIFLRILLAAVGLVIGLFMGFLGGIAAFLECIVLEPVYMCREMWYLGDDPTDPTPVP